MSRLLTGARPYPDLDLVLNVHNALSTEVEPSHPADWYQKTWEAGAWAALRPEEWIKGCIARVEKHSADDTEMPDDGTAGRGGVTEVKTPPIRLPRAASYLAGVVTAALLAAVLHVLGTGAPDGSGAAPTPTVAMCDRLRRCYTSPLVVPTFAPVRDGRRYVTYPDPRYSPDTPAGVDIAFEVYLLEDAPVYDRHYKRKKERSQAVYVGAGSTVYPQCTDTKGFVIVYGGNGDRLRLDSVRWMIEGSLDRGQTMAPYEPPAKCSDGSNPSGDVG
ncbi:hypothetical protein ACFUEN_35905 [Streptomyces griseorubiginosus]|uniref:hypothetical protein n=1 Tax=Streptomyces griseorubiginosus TaxID=67304 RepID=UPI003628E7FD